MPFAQSDSERCTTSSVPVCLQKRPGAPVLTSLLCPVSFEILDQDGKFLFLQNGTCVLSA